MRSKFDASLKEMEDKNSVLRNKVVEREDTIEQLQLELREKDLEISQIEDKYKYVNLVTLKGFVDFI